MAAQYQFPVSVVGYRLSLQPLTKVQEHSNSCDLELIGHGIVFLHTARIVVPDAIALLLQPSTNQPAELCS